MSPIPESLPNCIGVLLPFQPGFIYAAMESGDSSQETCLVFSSPPDFMKDNIHSLDVSVRKVMHFNIVKDEQ